MVKQCDFCKQPYPEHLPNCPHASRHGEPDELATAAGEGPAEPQAEFSDLTHGEEGGGGRWERAEEYEPIVPNGSRSEVPSPEPVEEVQGGWEVDEEAAQTLPAGSPESGIGAQGAGEPVQEADEFGKVLPEASDSSPALSLPPRLRSSADEKEKPGPEPREGRPSRWPFALAGAVLGAAACFGGLWGAGLVKVSDTPPGPLADPLAALVKEELDREQFHKDSPEEAFRDLAQDRKAARAALRAATEGKAAAEQALTEARKKQREAEGQIDQLKKKVKAAGVTLDQLPNLVTERNNLRQAAQQAKKPVPTNSGAELLADIATELGLQEKDRTKEKILARTSQLKKERTNALRTLEKVGAGLGLGTAKRNEDNLLKGVANLKKARNAAERTVRAAATELSCKPEQAPLVNAIKDLKNPAAPKTAAELLAAGRAELEAGRLSKALGLLGRKPKDRLTPELLEARGEARWLLRLSEAVGKPLAREDEEVRAAANELDKAGTARALLLRGQIEEETRNRRRAREIYEDGKKRFKDSPKDRALFDTALDRLDSRPADVPPGSQSRLLAPTGFRAAAALVARFIVAAPKKQEAEETVQAVAGNRVARRCATPSFAP